MGDLDLSLLGLEPGKVIWGQLGKAWWPGRVSFRLGDGLPRARGQECAPRFQTLRRDMHAPRQGG